MFLQWLILMRSFSFHWFIFWQPPRNLDKLTSKCSCDLVSSACWVTSSVSLPDLRIQHTKPVFEEVDFGSRVTKHLAWKAAGESTQCFSLQTWFRGLVPALCSRCGLGWELLGAEQFHRLCAVTGQSLQEWCCVAEGLLLLRVSWATEDPTLALCTV